LGGAVVNDLKGKRIDPGGSFAVLRYAEVDLVGMIGKLNYCRSDPQIAMLGSPGFGSRQGLIEISLGRF
jgi:hypothetical protein